MPMNRTLYPKNWNKNANYKYNEEESIVVSNI